MSGWPIRYSASAAARMMPAAAAICVRLTPMGVHLSRKPCAHHSYHSVDSERVESAGRSPSSLSTSRLIGHTDVYIHIDRGHATLALAMTTASVPTPPLDFCVF